MSTPPSNDIIPLLLYRRMSGEVKYERVQWQRWPLCGGLGSIRFQTIYACRHRGSTSASATMCAVSASRDRVDHILGCCMCSPDLTVVGSRLDLERKDIRICICPPPSCVHCCAHCCVIDVCVFLWSVALLVSLLVFTAARKAYPFRLFGQIERGYRACYRT